MSVTFAELKEATPEKRRRLLAEIVERSHQPANGRVEELREAVEAFAATYKVSAPELRDKVYYGDVAESEEVTDWLMDYKLLEHIESKEG